ncbi:dihydromonapterin reductase [Glaciecola petra]|uniref:Dihydromonapterin reductase n=1 Tax=Glaciecola petra TaxID=3075602 RepID=A0ABU2ZUB9_9ALTE|nr:dihydromonapterin reductase [Aestuariibacter sp. P117]MDT0596221.1 dihydromonapterin reductase [Aestuariibacter sp. P117]
MSAPILITGGAQRLGLAIAKDLLSRQFKVIITYRSKKPSIDELIAQGCIAIQADFSTDNGIAACINEIQSHAQSIRAIIHNASDWDSEKSGMASGLDAAQIMQKMMQVHVSAPYQINLACKEMLTDHADIIHMTDYVQDKGSNKHIAYAASKAALHNLTLSFASLLAPSVKVNSIAPSLLMFNIDDTEQYKQKALSKSILGICPGAQEAVKAVNFLLNSDYVTGQTLHLNGGRHLK